MRHGRVWKILRRAVEAEHVAVKRERRIQILDGVDGVRKAPDPGLGLVRRLGLRQGDESHYSRRRNETKGKRDPHKSPSSRKTTWRRLHQLREYIAMHGSAPSAKH